VRGYIEQGVGYFQVQIFAENQFGLAGSDEGLAGEGF
jgi:hypothetical protein